MRKELIIIIVCQTDLRMDKTGAAEVESIGELERGGPWETLRRSQLSAHNPIC